MRTAIVTGAARGLGRAISERLTADGLAVWAVDADAEELARMAVDVGARSYPMDVTDEAAVEGLVAALDTCDVLVNNAAIWRFTPLASTPVDEAQRVLSVNVVAPLLLMQRLLPLLTRSESAAIVNISSITAKYSPTSAG
ncbi:MAG TPA: SDR family oxidoreductase, partial [Mycobacterium sp.]|nr:SDR family oxidoreductase [Mycobacterium sp.]